MPAGPFPASSTGRLMRTTPISEMDKRFDPRSYESRWQQEWAAKGYFVCDVRARFFGSRRDGARRPYCIMIPPPNVTGKLHIGHALQSTLQDLLTRWRRMQGRNALWLPGTDHAGIATQVMVERDLAKEGKSRHELGPRELPRAHVGVEGAVPGQHLAASSTASAPPATGRASASLSTTGFRARFARPSSACIDEGLIYRGEYIVNWSPGAATPRSPTSRSRCKAGRRQALELRLPARGRQQRAWSSPRPGPRRCSATPPSPCTPRTSATGI